MWPGRCYKCLWVGMQGRGWYSCGVGRAGFFSEQCGREGTHRRTSMNAHASAAHALYQRAPRCGSGPNCPFKGPPIPEDPSLKPQPLPPPPSSPGSFSNAPAGGPGWCGGGVYGIGWWRGRTLQLALGARSTSGGARLHQRLSVGST